MIGSCLPGKTPTCQPAQCIKTHARRCPQVHFTIGRACPSCPRGALAARALQPGDVVAAVPAAASIPLGSASVPRAALALLKRQRLDPAFNASFGPYLAALPRPGQVFAAELFSADELQALQTPELVSRRVGAPCMAPGCRS